MTAIAPQDRYRRLDLLGRGGMGEVFLADDLLLRRKVAIKVVHRTALANQRAEKLLRREAKAAAALDNPFICKVYEVGEAEGRVFIAMEYIQGETLRQRMHRGSVTTREVLNVAREIADGLEEAGRKRVIHRDLKPSNIILTPQGHVKIMDFGLAKRLPGEESAEESTGTPEGMVVGTREYMSPEQLRGKPLEPSSDLFALGLILYEMLCGAHPFKKASAIDTQFAILNEAPEDLFDRGCLAPDALQELVHQLLAKLATDRPRISDVRERLAAITDVVRPETNNPEKTVSSSTSVEAFVARKPRVVLALGLALLVAVIGLSLWVALRPEATMPQAKMATLVTWPSNEEHASLSPDFKSLTFISNRDGVKDIWLLDLAGGEPRRITNAPGNLTSQAFSEDGSEIAYTLESDAQKLFQTIRLDGGPPTRSLSLPADLRVRRMIRWVGDRVFMETQRLDLVSLSASSGQLAVIPTLPWETTRRGGFDVTRDGKSIAFGGDAPDGSRPVWAQLMGSDPQPISHGGYQDVSPFFSDPLGRRRMFFESNRSGQEDLWLMERPGREPRQITFGSNREFIESVSADGTIIVFSEILEGASIFSFDPQTNTRTQLTAENKRDITPSVAANGLLAFSRVSLSSTAPYSLSSILLGSFTDGRLENPRVVVRDGSNPLLSPSGKWLAYFVQSGVPAAPHLYVLNVETGHSRELGEMPTSSKTFQDFPWIFNRRDIHWSAQEDVLFIQGTRADSRVVRVSPQSEVAPVTLAQLKPQELASQLTTSSDGSRLFYLRLPPGGIGGAVHEISSGRDVEVYPRSEGELAILGMRGNELIVAEQPSFTKDVVRLKSCNGVVVRDLFEIQGRLATLRLLPGLNVVSFSRRSARDVENVFLKRLDSLAETPITENGIQGIGFSPVTMMTPSRLVFSQQLRNKDLGIIRLDRP